MKVLTISLFVIFTGANAFASEPRVLIFPNQLGVVRIQIDTSEGYKRIEILTNNTLIDSFASQNPAHNDPSIKKLESEISYTRTLKLEKLGKYDVIVRFTPFNGKPFEKSETINLTTYRPIKGIASTAFSLVFNRAKKQQNGSGVLSFTLLVAPLKEDESLKFQKVRINLQAKPVTIEFKPVKSFQSSGTLELTLNAQDFRKIEDESNVSMTVYSETYGELIVDFSLSK